MEAATDGADAGPPPPKEEEADAEDAGGVGAGPACPGVVEMAAPTAAEAETLEDMVAAREAEDSGGD